MHNKTSAKPNNDVMRHRIDELRKEAGMTQDTYGREILHCSQGTASQKLSGQLALSALDIFGSATAFNVSTDYLYGLTDTRTRKDAEKRETAMAPA